MKRNYSINTKKLLQYFLISFASFIALNASTVNAQRRVVDTLTAEELKNYDGEQLVALRANDRFAQLLMKDKKVLLTTRTALTDYLRYVAEVTNYKDNYDKTFTKLEYEATYPGGLEAWQAYVTKNLRFPPGAIEDEIQGTVLVSLIVDIDGTIHDVEAVGGPERLKKQAVEFVKSAGNWLPGIQNKRLEKSYKRIPVTFRLPEKGYSTYVPSPAFKNLAILNLNQNYTAWKPLPLRKDGAPEESLPFCFSLSILLS
jgi:hypothetical protein